MMISKFIFFVAIAGLMFSCDRPECKNANPIFDNYSPVTNQYKDELARQLQMPEQEDLTYWLDKYESIGDKEYILVYIQGGELCAKGLVLVNNWSKLEGIRRTKGESYHGAELRGLEIDIRRDEQTSELIFNDLDRIIDQ
jgi:hypothetical protein